MKSALAIILLLTATLLAASCKNFGSAYEYDEIALEESSDLVITDVVKTIADDKIVFEVNIESDSAARPFAWWETDNGCFTEGSPDGMSAILKKADNDLSYMVHLFVSDGLGRVETKKILIAPDEFGTIESPERSIILNSTMAISKENAAFSVAFEVDNTDLRYAELEVSDDGVAWRSIAHKSIASVTKWTISWSPDFQSDRYYFKLSGYDAGGVKHLLKTGASTPLIADQSSSSSQGSSSSSGSPSGYGGSDFVEAPGEIYINGLNSYTEYDYVTLHFRKLLDSRGEINVLHYEVQYWNTGDMYDRNGAMTIQHVDNSDPGNRYAKNSVRINNLVDDKRYHFRVRGINDYGAGPWSVPVGIDVKIPNAPGKASNPSPSVGQTGVAKQPTLTWTAYDPDQEATEYYIHFGFAPDNLAYNVRGFDSDRSEISTFDFTTEYHEPLPAGATIYWAVDTRDESGLVTRGDVWHFTTEAVGTDLAIVSAVALDPILPNSKVRFRLTLRNMGVESTKRNWLKAIYRKNGKSSPFRNVNPTIIEPLAPGETREMDVTISFKSSVIIFNDVEFDNVLFKGESQILFETLHIDTQDVDPSNNVAVIEAAYSGGLPPVVKHFYLGDRSTYEAGSFSTAQGQTVIIAAEANDDMQVSSYFIEIQPGEGQPWVLIRGWEENEYETNRFYWTDDFDNLQGMRTAYTWTVPETIATTDSARLRIRFIDNEGLQSIALSTQFPIYSNDMELAIEPLQTSYLEGDLLTYTITGSTSNGIAGLYPEIVCGTELAELGVFYAEDGLVLQDHYTWSIPVAMTSSSTSCYLDLRVLDLARNERYIQSSLFSVNPNTEFPSPFNGYTVLYDNSYTFPSGATYIDEFKTIKFVVLDSSNSAHAIITHAGFYHHNGIDRHFEKTYYSKVASDGTQSTKLLISQYDLPKTDPEPPALVDFRLHDGIPYLLYSDATGSGARFTYRKVMNVSSVSAVISAGEYDDVKDETGRLYSDGAKLYIYWVWDNPASTSTKDNKLQMKSIAPSSESPFSFSTSGVYINHVNGIRLHDDAIYVACGQFLERSGEQSVSFVGKFSQNGCAHEGDTKAYGNSSVYDLIPEYAGGKYIPRVVFKDMSTDTIEIDASEPDAAIFENEIMIVSKSSSSRNVLGKKAYKITTFDLSRRDRTDLLFAGRGAGFSNFANIVDINENKFVALGNVASGATLAIADFSKDVIPPTVAFENEDSDYSQGSAVTLNWSAHDAEGLSKVELIKRVDGTETVMMSMANPINSDFTFDYTFAEKDKQVIFKAVAIDLAGNRHNDVVAFTPIQGKVSDILHFSSDKATLFEGESISFSWDAAGADQQSVYHVLYQRMGATGWSVLEEVIGGLNVSVSLNDFTGQYRFKLAVDGLERELDHTIAIEGPFEFIDESFSAGEVLSNNGHFTLLWNDTASGSKDVLYALSVKKKGESEFHDIATLSTAGQMSSQGVKSIKEASSNDTNGGFTYFDNTNEAFSYKVTAYYEGLAYESKEIGITPVTLKAPAILTIAHDDKPSVSITAQGDPRTDMFEVFKSADGLNYEKMLETPLTFFNDNNVSFRKSYAYYIKARSGKVLSKPSPIESIYISDNPANSVTIDNQELFTASDAIDLHFTADPKNAFVSYQVYLGESMDERSLIASTVHTSVSIQDLKANTTYYALVEALDSHGTVSATSDYYVFSTPMQKNVVGGAMHVTSELQEDSSVKLTYSGVVNESEFYIYRDDKFIEVTVDGEYVDVNTVPGSVYQYSVVALDDFANFIEGSVLVEIPQEEESDQDGDGIPDASDPYANDGPNGDFDGDGILNSADSDDSDGASLSEEERYYLQGTKNRLSGNIEQDTQPYPNRPCGYYGDHCRQGTTTLLEGSLVDGELSYSDLPTCDEGLIRKQGSGVCVAP